jgi:hypothetical protein
MRSEIKLETILDAKTKLDEEGLHVSHNNPQSLWIAATVRDRGSGIKLSNDACSLTWNSSRWMAVFPAEGLLTYEVPGSLSELVALIKAIYADYRQVGGSLADAVKRVLPDVEQYLSGRSPAHV